MRNSKKREQVFQAIQDANLCKRDVNRQEIMAVMEANGLNFPQWIYEYSTGYNRFDLTTFNNHGRMSVMTDVAETKAKVVPIKPIVSERVETNPNVPEINPNYVPWGNYNDLKTIIGSGMFYPFYVAGLSGNGKTVMIEQVCANTGRELIRTNITAETDETDLIGGFRLVNGETVWEDGPAITAMKTGAVLLLDEVDLGTPKIMCLQPILEGKAYYIKKTKTLVKPVKGFNVCATANTKGNGSDDGMFIGTMVMNEAFLERFSVTFEQDYPPRASEEKMLTLELLSRTGKTELKDDDAIFINCLVSWARQTRASFQNGLYDYLITTRRLVHIITAYTIFDKKEHAVQLSLNRFPEDIKKAYFDLYCKLDNQIAEERAKKIAEQVKAEKEERRKAREAAKLAKQMKEEKAGTESEPVDEDDPKKALEKAIQILNAERDRKEYVSTETDIPF